MKILKPLFAFFLAGSLIFISSCESDDFCTQTPVTPNLVLRFYDNANRTDLKAVQRLSVIAQGKTDSLFTNTTIDSIALPLNPLAQETVYILKKNEIDGNLADNEIETLVIKYTPEDEYVSRSCGFRVIFNNVTVEVTGTPGWVDELQTTQIASLNTQNNAHVNVFH
ncbi:DUF6452 family protein [Tenacibaculum amylolyticum]|uniref:DUF6452 family protein n=1 Tax=Tenacibaculum amylolyticum TaxID=104269 RepID=UPI003893FF26